MTRALVSFRRIRKYLSCEELDSSLGSDETMSGRRDKLRDDRYAASLMNCSFGWNLEEEPILKEISINIKKGSFVAIVGRVGSGKSSLFSALMGDMYRRAGERNVLNGSVSYVPQSAWIQNLTLRQNIVFVSDYESDKYERVVKACALETDFNLLPAKDMTEIGEKGINLSGGQKHRVSLARAVYQDSDIYLLDDPLAAVDAHVGQHLFQEVIGPKGLLKKKTRILATHHISFLKDADQILVMKDGKIVDSGGYEELSERGMLSEEVLNESDNKSIGSEDKMSRQTSHMSGNESIGQLSRQISRQMSRQTSRLLSPQLSIRSDSTEPKAETLKERLEREAESDQLIDEESQQFGSIKYTVYLDYLKRIPLLFVVIPLLCAFMFNMCEVGANYWLNIWTTKNSNTTAEEEKTNRNEFLIIYLSAILLDAIFVLVMQVIMRYGALKASEVMHKDMLYCILRTPLSFFDTTPLGRIINRFNRDFAKIDEEIPFCMTESVMTFIWFVLILGVIVYTNAYMAILILIVSVLFVFLYRIYLWTSRQLTRLEAITKSPIYSHFNESISGAVSIRVYNVQQMFTEKLQNFIDINTNIERHQYSTQMWIDIWTSIFGQLITLSTALFVVLQRGVISPGLAGFVLIYSVDVINSISWALKNTADLETEMVCVERVREYSELDSEKSWQSTDAYKPSDDWPTSSSIDFINYSASYRPGLEPVLKELNFRIESGEKVGIVGRTGAGKSSITLALFRIIEPTFGQILIDGVDVTRIGLHDLRSKLTIIPQEPNLFAGTLRLNLDPFEE
ncbi:unnamed protein product, partial [Medioppia subpectinata]